jgi:SAM-dependent methyltransferase
MNQRVLEAYEKVANSYDTFYQSPDDSRENLEIMQMVSSFCSKPVLDIGCGTGLLLDILPSTKEYLGIDIAPSMLKMAQKKHSGQGRMWASSVFEFENPENDDLSLVSLFGSISYLDEKELQHLSNLCQGKDYFFMHYKDGYAGRITANSIKAPRSYEIKKKFANFHDVNYYLYGNYIIVTNKKFNLPGIDTQPIWDGHYTFARTMPHFPHAYLLKQKIPVSQHPLFDKVVRFIRSNGYKQIHAGREYIYFNHNHHQYWTMGAPVEETILINRARL